jgi:NitT/TauT family transport system permease protein
VAAIAIEQPGRAHSWLRRIALYLIVPGFFIVFYSTYRWLGIHFHWTRPFVVDDITMPSLRSIVSALFEPARVNGPLLITVLGRAALFTAKEAVVGFALGASIGFVLGALLFQSKLLQRGFMPYIVASQTVPILAVAPMVVVWMKSGWQSVAVIAAYLTFFPVTINTLRGLQSADPRAIELMRSYAASPWTVLWKVRVPSALPFLFAAFKISATACVVGAIIGELPSSIQDGLGGAILNYAQYYSIEPADLWATNIIAALLGITFFLVVVIVERLVVRRAPEHVA